MAAINHKTLKFPIVISILVTIGLAHLAVEAEPSHPGQSVIYSHAKTDYEGFFIDAGKSTPLVFLVHDWDGLTDYEIRRSQMLAQNGYSVFALDLFGRGIRPTKVKDRRQHTGALYQNRTKLRGIMTAAIESAKRKGANVSNAVMVGYCFGGAAVLELARSGHHLKGFVSIHGGLSTPLGQDYSKTHGQILVQHGAADTNITMDDFVKLTHEFEQFKVSHQMTVYGGAPHAWTVFGGNRYHALADKRSWRQLLDFLTEVLHTKP